MKGIVLLVICLLAAATSGRAISEEQANQHSWYQQHIGKPIKVLFAFKGRDRCFLSTVANVVASVDLRDGSIVWRQTFLESDSIDDIALIPKPAAVSSVSDHGRTLRAWHAGDGALLWETVLSSRVSSNADQPEDVALKVLPDVNGDGSSDIALLANRRLQVVSGKSGKLIWSLSLPDDWLTSSLSVIQAENGLTLAVLGLEASQKEVATWFVSSAVGEILDKQVQQLPGTVQGALVVKANKIFAVTDSQDKLCSLPLQGDGEVSCKELEGTSGSKGLELVKFNSERVLAVRLKGGMAVLAIGDVGIQSISFIPGGSVVTDSVAAADDEGVVVGGVSDDGLPWAKLAWAREWLPVQLSVPQWTSRRLAGAAIGLDAAAFSARDFSSKEAVQKILLVAADDSTALVEQGKATWVKEEALASVTGSLFLDLPAPSPELAAQWQAAAPSLSERVQAEFLGLKDHFGFNNPQETDQLSKLKARMSSQLLPFRDPNGFRKLLVLLSKSGKVFGLHSGDGHLLWSLSFPADRRPSRLALWRTSHDAASAPEVLLLGNLPSGDAFYTTLNAHSGAVTSSGDLPFRMDQMLELAQHWHDGKAEQRVYALVTDERDEPSVHVLPDVPAARAQLSSPAKPLYFWRIKVNASVEGFAVTADGKASLLWSVAFPSTDAILAFASADPHASVYSFAKVLGDRSLKLKYLNPNTLFVATGTLPGQTESGSSRHVSAHIFDTVTGRLLFSQKHEDANGPVHAVLAENWVVYSYWSRASHRFQISTVELYDASPRNLTALQLVFGGSGNATISSYRPVQLEVLRQSFLLPFGIKALAVTASSKGITSKMVLMGTFSDQVYMMDKRFLDPRRPLGTPTAEDKAEMLIPYAAELPVSLQSFASHQRQVANLKGIDSAPANLESTSFALAHGLDLYLTRVQPSNTFDLLPEDFPFALLIAITVTMIGASVALKYMGEKTSVKQKWA